MQWVTQVAKNLEKAISVELVVVQSIIWKTASLRSKVGPKDLAGIPRKKSLVRLLLLFAIFALSHMYGQPMNAGSAYQILRLRELVHSNDMRYADFYSATGNISSWQSVVNVT